MANVEEADFADHAVHLEYVWRNSRYMLTSESRPSLFRISAHGLVRLGTFKDHASAERVFWEVVTLTIHDAEDHLADLRINGTGAAVVLDGPPGGRAHLAVRSVWGFHIAQCFDTSHEALDAWVQLAAELALSAQ